MPMDFSRKDSEGLQAVPNDTILPQAVKIGEGVEVGLQHPKIDVYPEHYYQAASPNEKKPFLGLRKTTLLLSLCNLLMMVALVVLGASFGAKKTLSSVSPPAPAPLSCPGVNNNNVASTIQIITRILTLSTASGTPPTTPTTPTTSAAAISSAISTSTPTAPSTSGYVAPTDETVALDCPNLSGKNITSTYYPVNPAPSYDFAVTCGMDCESQNIFPIWAYSLDMCIQACVGMNQYHTTNKKCTAVVLRTDMGYYLQRVLGGNCFLKTNCSKPVVPDKEDVEKFVYATLLN